MSSQNDFLPDKGIFDGRLKILKTVRTDMGNLFIDDVWRVYVNDFPDFRSINEVESEDRNTD